MILVGLRLSAYPVLLEQSMQSGLVSAAVAGFLSQAYFAFQTTSQDVSAFYLKNLYLLQASSNNTEALLKLTPPVTGREPYVSLGCWFASLGMSFMCAVGSTMVQEWIRRYQLLTQLWSSPHRRAARIRASISRDGFLEFVPLFLKSLNLLLHLSIYLFLAGLTALPIYFDDISTYWIAIYFILALAGYIFFAFGIPFRPRPLILFRYSSLMIYDRNVPHSSILSNLLVTARRIDEDASTQSLTLDADTMSWLLDSLTDEEDFEQFLTGIPGFYKSTQVENPAKVLEEANTNASPKAILAFMDRPLSSDLPEDARRQRLNVSLEAMKSDPYLLQRTFYHAVRLCATESSIFKSVDFVLLADKHADDADVNIRSLTRSIIAIAISHLEDYRTDERWTSIVQRRLNWAKDPFPREPRDNIKLRNLVLLARELNTPRPGSDSLSPEVFRDSLREVCKLSIRNASHKLQNEFCNLWNDLVIEARRPVQDSDPVLLSYILPILSSIHSLHVSLHQDAESQSSTSPTHIADAVLQNPTLYSPCTISHGPVTSVDPSTNISVAHDSGVSQARG